MLLFFGITGQLISQSENLCWSIDYRTWDTTGQPSLYIDCGNDEAFNPGGELTLEAWVRAYTFAENRKFMGKIFYNEPIDNGYVLGFENLHVYAEYFNPTKQEVPRPGDGPMAPDSSFVHIVSTYSNESGSIKNYVNGMLVGETTMFPNTPIVPNDRPFIIGNAPWDFFSFQFYGDMDEVRVWNTALDQDQIQASMHTQLTGSEEGLIAYYNFNSAEGEFVPDEGPNGFDGVLSNYDHQSTSWATSSAPVGNEIMATMNDVGAIWYRNMENYHKLITQSGIIVIANIPEKDFRKYIVAGHNGQEGVSNTFEPVTEPVGFKRTSREWYFNSTGNVIGGLSIILEEAAVGGDIPDMDPPENYALLYRSNTDENFRALYHPTVPWEGIMQFSDIEFKDGYYALGYSTEEFPIQGPDAIPESIFADIKLSPNPVTRVLNIEGIPKNTTISIYNIAGSLIGTHISNLNKNQIDFTDVKAGVYMIMLENNSQRISKKIVKNK